MSPERSIFLALRVALAVVLVAVPVAAQDPPPPRTDTATVERGDSVREPPLPDSVAADTLPAFHNLPTLEDGIPSGWAGGVWTWDHEQIMASGANTLVELVDEVPGVVPLLAGDYGTPAAFSAFGAGAGGVRVLRDGFELLPLAGGVVDLQRVGLAGIERVRLRRSAGEVVVEMWSLDHDDARPFSLVEAGTGDLDNNLFRGTFTSPNALGGSVAVALERSDSRGAARGETGSRTGSWLRYQLHKGDEAGLAVDFRRMGSRSEVADYPSPVTRTDVSLRGRIRLLDGLVAEAYTGSSSHDVEDERLLYATEGGSRGQHGVRVSAEHRGFWSNAAFRLHRGGDLAENRLDVEGGWSRPGLGGVTARFTREDWVGARPKSYGLSGWLGPWAGFTLFGSRESGSYGGRSGPTFDVSPPQPDTGEVTDPAWEERPPARLLVAERTSYRVGASFSWKGTTASVAALGLDQDRSLPLGIAPDFGASPVPGEARRGWEAHAVLPMPLEGLRFVGAYQEWDRPGPYLPARIYRGRFDFQRAFLESGNFELRASVGVRGHDPMEVFTPGSNEGSSGLERVPFFQSWDGRIQARIVTVRVFVSWENLTVRRNLQAFPGRVLPALRTSYGIRWTMWN
ncbi:MAG: TonB-dependent receptor plug domain-containing protein [Gemmatimonadota bacterium]|nr:TonB-dependent receptor plug domain-containing protein [Gemmatimonadota bacterium]